MKNAIVTGGTRGIGLAIAKMLISEDYHVVVTYSHDETAAENCRKELTAMNGSFEIIKADNSDRPRMREFAEKMRLKGHIDCLVCNAGITLRKPFCEISDEEWDRVMEVNLTSNVHLVRNLMPVIPGGSRIVFITSLMGVIPHAVSLPYGISKAGLIALSRDLVKIFAGTGTTVNAIVPGFADTDWHDEKDVARKRKICDKIAAGRFADPAEIAEAVRFCLRNAYVNGSAIEVSGGYCFE